MSTASPMRALAYAALEQERAQGAVARLVRAGLIALILLNVVVVMLESVPEYASAHARAFRVIDVFSVGVFTVEYALRLWACVEDRRAAGKTPWRARVAYALTPLAIIDLLAIAPFYLGALFAVDLRVLRVLRLLRLLKLTRYFAALGLLADVLRAEARAFGAALVVMGTLMVIAASGIYLVEHAEQPEVFGSIPAAMWWAIVTLSTVGYGDVVPVTAAGKVIGAVIMVLGIGVVALPAGMLASRFSAELHRRSELFRRRVGNAVENGVLSPHEQAELQEEQRALCLTDEDASRAITDVLSERGVAPPRCPHCGSELRDAPEDG